MKKIKEFREEIDEAIERIKSLEKSERDQVRNIYKTMYDKYLSLKREDFDDDFYYKLYLKFRIIKAPIVEMELNSLLDNNDEDCLTDNFFQIKASLIGFSLGLERENYNN